MEREQLKILSGQLGEFSDNFMEQTLRPSRQKNRSSNSVTFKKQTTLAIDLYTRRKANLAFCTRSEIFSCGKVEILLGYVHTLDGSFILETFYFLASQRQLFKLEHQNQKPIFPTPRTHQFENGMNVELQISVIH